jgi:phosphatidylinositol glycan class T
VPGRDRKRPHQIEIKLNLEANSVYSIYFKAEFAYLKWDEFPPDVNHGFYINPALVTIDLKDNLKYLKNYRSFNDFSNIYDK